MDLKTLGERINAAALAREWSFVRPPSTDQLEQMAALFNVTDAEARYWFGLAGYLPVTRFPPPDETVTVLEFVYDTMLHDHPYPAYILDYQFNFWAVNRAAVGLVGSEERMRALMRRFINVFDMVFDSKNGLTRTLADAERVQTQQVRGLFARNHMRRHELFWSAYPSSMAQRWNTTDFDRFQQVWDTVSQEPTDVPTLIRGGQCAELRWKLQPDLEIEFLLKARPVPYFGDNRFEVIEYIPIGTGVSPAVDSYFAQFQATSDDALKAWKLQDPGELIARLNTWAD